MTETTEKKPFICSICGGNIDVQPGGWDRISGIRSCSKSTSGRLGFAAGWPLAIGGYTQPMTENTETEHLQAARDLAMQLHIEDYATAGKAAPRAEKTRKTLKGNDPASALTVLTNGLIGAASVFEITPQGRRATVIIPEVTNTERNLTDQ